MNSPVQVAQYRRAGETAVAKGHGAAAERRLGTSTSDDWASGGAEFTTETRANSAAARRLVVTSIACRNGFSLSGCAPGRGNAQSCALPAETVSGRSAVAGTPHSANSAEGELSNERFHAVPEQARIRANLSCAPVAGQSNEAIKRKRGQSALSNCPRHSKPLGDLQPDREATHKVR
jgi:hypothetical protein